MPPPTRSPSPYPDLDEIRAQLAFEVYDQGYEDGRSAGFKDGFKAGLAAARKLESGSDVQLPEQP